MNICILGGGTAGWLAALFISKIKPNHKITVIESSNVGIIGAGEGSTGLLSDIVSNRIWNFGCNELEFIRETGATLKYGILHKNWTKNNNQDYFGPLDGTVTAKLPVDYLFAYAHTHLKKPHTATMLGMLIDDKKCNFDFTFNFIRDKNIGHAFHFDAHKVGQYFKKICLKQNHVQHIDVEVNQVKINEQGFIKSLITNTGSELEFDFYIDASGFSRILMKSLDSKWISYNSNLPVNSAMPFVLKYNENQHAWPYTTAWAQSSGWMWQIPQQERIGCGYVFCDQFISADKAQQEIEVVLGQEIDPIRILKFDTGRFEKPWIKNCLSIGLCAAFAEPLEATSIHSTIVQLHTFVFEYLKNSIAETCNQGSLDSYNKRMSCLYDDFKDFLVMHYMGGRIDSEFWRFINTGETQTEKVSMLLSTAKSRLPSHGDMPDYLGSAGWGLWSYVMAGTGNIDKNVCFKELKENKIDDSTDLLTAACQIFKQKRNEYDSIAKTFMNYHNFLKFIKR